MSEKNLEEYLSAAVEAAQEGGEIARNARETGFSVSMKGELDLVTQADLAVNDCIVRMLTRRFPKHFILSEEGERSGKIDLAGPTWIIDPIDGTTNFVHGQLHVGVSVAFADKGKILAGAVCAPFLGETYSAARGGGAFCNGEPIQVSSCKELKSALVATGFPYNRSDLGEIIARVTAVLRNCRDLRRIGACSMDICWVASGKLDAYYETVNPWDMAAGALIAREAGAALGHFRPQPANDSTPPELYSKDLLVCTPGLLEKMLGVLRV